MAIKKKPEEHENHERWLVSYADFITLLFAFFVVMYSVSSRDAAKVKQIELSLVQSFGSYETGPMERQNGPPFTDREAERYTPITNTFQRKNTEEILPEDMYDESDPLRKFQRSLESTLQSEGANRAFRITMDKKGLRLTANESVLFSESGAIKKSLEPAMLALSKKIKSFGHEIFLEGTAVPVNERSLQAGLNELQKQQLSVFRFFTDEGKIDPQIIQTSTVGKSNFGFDRSEEIGDGTILDIFILRRESED